MRLLLLVADLLIDPVHVLMGDGRKKRILHTVPRNGKAEGIWAAVNLLAVRAVAERVIVDPIGFVVDHTPTILGRNVAQSVVVERKRVLELPQTIGKGLLVFLL